MNTLPAPLSHYIDNIMPRMDGWCSKEKAEALVRHILRDHPQSVLEIGVFAGRSLFAIGLALKSLGSGHAVGVDPWTQSASVEGFSPTDENRKWWGALDHQAIYYEARDYLSRLELGEHVSLFRGTSEQAAILLSLAPGRFLDLLHIDGNHSESQALQDVRDFVPLLKPGGILAFDDLDWNSTRPAQAQISAWCEHLETVNNCGFFSRNDVP